MNAGFFVTGTDTEIGKTVVAAGLVARLAAGGQRVAAMKPVASGAEKVSGALRNADAELLIRAANVPAEYALVNPYVFAPAIAPHLAAAEAGTEIDLDHIAECCDRLRARADRIVVEGVGGWRVPLNAREDVAALAARLGLPVVLVVGMRLGCINHALLTAAAIRDAGSALAGWVANQPGAPMARADDNLAVLRARIDAPLIGCVPWLATPRPERVADCLDLSQLQVDPRAPDGH